MTPVPLPQAAQPEPTSRAEINRANSQHSTGPSSEPGKTRSSQNAFKHGLYSKKLVLPGEDPAELDRLKEDLRTEHQPANQTESILVNEMAEQFWRLRRMRELEARSFTIENLENSIASGLLPLIQRTMASAERGFHKALTDLRRLQKDHGFVPSRFPSRPQAAGFVPSFPSEQGLEHPEFDALIDQTSSNLPPPRMQREVDALSAGLESFRRKIAERQAASKTTAG
ncbi:MAG TPA: hypothetical protein VLI55_11900 [Bryobacteraceae bacterium]|nr:hypothetical protein [Bryobacteraceae bacterium]